MRLGYKLLAGRKIEYPVSGLPAAKKIVCWKEEKQQARI